MGIPYSNDMWPLHPDFVDLPPDAEARKWGYPDLPFFVGDEVVNPKITGEDQVRFTTQFTELAVDFIERHKDRPFFVYVPHPMPHVPLFVSDAFAGETERGLYGDVIEEIDWSVGRVLETLERLDLDDNTLVIVTSDNGPWLRYGDHAGSARPLREGKTTTWDGGVRVPCVMRWPDRLPAGRVIGEPVMAIDLLPTIANLIGAELPAHPIDGLDIIEVIAEGGPTPHEALYFYWNRGLQAVRQGKWKLHVAHTYRTLAGRPGGTDGKPAPIELGTTELALFDLEADPGQTTNVASEFPEIVARLDGLADRIRAELGDTYRDIEGRSVREPGRVDDDE